MQSPTLPDEYHLQKTQKSNQNINDNNNSPRNLRTVFLDGGKEVLDHNGKSALLENLHILAHRKQKEREELQKEPSSNNINNISSTSRSSSPITTNTITLSTSKSSSQQGHHHHHHHHNQEEFANKLMQFASLAHPDSVNEHQPILEYQQKEREKQKQKQQQEEDVNIDNNASSSSMYNNTRRRASKAVALIEKGAEKATKLQIERERFREQIMRLCVHEGLMPAHLLQQQQQQNSPSKKMDNQQLFLFPSLRHRRKKEAEKLLAKFAAATATTTTSKTSEEEENFFVEGDNKQEHQQEKEGESSDVSVSSKSAIDVPLACPHCKLTSEIPPANHVRPLFDQKVPSSVRYLIPLTALNEDELDERLWTVLSSLSFDEVLQKQASSSLSAESTLKTKKKSIRKKEQNTTNTENDNTQQKSEDSSSEQQQQQEEKEQEQQEEKEKQLNERLAQSIAQHFEFRIGAPPWHEHWTRLDRIAEELRERKLTTNEHNKVRLTSLEHEYAIVQAQVKALSLALLEVNPVDKARSLETEEQTAYFECSSYREALRIIEEQMKHLHELEFRSLVHTALAVEESRRGVSAISDFADFVRRCNELGQQFDVGEVGTLMADVIASAPVVAKDEQQEAELLTNRQTETMVSGRYQCADCLLMCNWSKYCPMTGKEHPNIPIPGHSEEDDLFSTAAAEKTSVLLAEADLTSTARDHTHLAKMVMATANIERQRMKDEEAAYQLKVQQSLRGELPEVEPLPPPPSTLRRLHSQSKKKTSSSLRMSTLSGSLHHDDDDDTNNPKTSKSGRNRSASPNVKNISSSSSSPSPHPPSKNTKNTKTSGDDKNPQEQQHPKKPDVNYSSSGFLMKKQQQSHSPNPTSPKNTSTSEQYSSTSPKQRKNTTTTTTNHLLPVVDASYNKSPNSPMNTNTHSTTGGASPTVSELAASACATHTGTAGSPSLLASALFSGSFRDDRSPSGSPNVSVHLQQQQQQQQQYQYRNNNSSNNLNDSLAGGGGGETLTATATMNFTETLSASKTLLDNTTATNTNVDPDEFLNQTSTQHGHHYSTQAFVHVGITNDEEAEEFIQGHVEEMLQCAVRRDIEGLRWHNKHLSFVVNNPDDNKHIPKHYADSLLEVEKMFVEWFAAMVRRQREEAKIAKIGASRIANGDRTTTQTLRRGILEDRIRKYQREIRDVTYSIAKRPKGRTSAVTSSDSSVDEDSVFEALALRVRTLQRRKGGLRSKIRSAADEHRAVEARIHALRGELYSPRAVQQQMAAAANSQFYSSNTPSTTTPTTFATAAAASATTPPATTTEQEEASFETREPN